MKVSRLVPLGTDTHFFEQSPDPVGTILCGFGGHICCCLASSKDGFHLVATGGVSFELPKIHLICHFPRELSFSRSWDTCDRYQQKGREGSSSTSSLHLCWRTHGFRSLPNRFMYKVLLVFGWCFWLSCRHHSAYSTSERAATTCVSSTPVVAIQERLCAVTAHPGGLESDLQDLVFAPLKGHSIHQEDQIPHRVLRSDGRTCEQSMAVFAMQATLQGYCGSLPKLWKTLEQMLRQAVCSQQPCRQFLELDEHGSKRSFTTFQKSTEHIRAQQKGEGKRQKASQRRHTCLARILLTCASCCTLDAGSWTWRSSLFIIECPDDGFRALGSNQAQLSRCFADAERDQGHGREITRDGQQTDHPRPPLGHNTVGKGQEMLGRVDGIPRCTSSGLDEIPEGVHRFADPTTREVQRSREAVYGADGEWPKARSKVHERAYRHSVHTQRPHQWRLFHLPHQKLQQKS